MTESTLTQERLAYLDLMREVEDFFYLEADLLDEREYDQWLDLLTEDIVYWMPMRKNVSYANRDKDTTEEDDLAWIHDDKETLRKRVKQIQTGVHWADEPTLLLFEFLAREIRSARVLLLGTYRDVELRRQHPLARVLGDLAREPHYRRVPLSGLAADDVARIIEATT